MMARLRLALGLSAVLLPLLLITAALAQSVAPAAPTAVQVRFAHWAPFASSASDTEVEVRVNGDAVGSLSYGDKTGYRSLGSAGDYLVEVVFEGNVVLAQTVPLPDGPNSVAVIGDIANLPLDLFILQDSTTTPAPGRSSLRVAHASPFAFTTDESRIDVCTDDGVPFDKSANGLRYKRASITKQIPANNYDLKITLADIDEPCAGPTLFDLPLLDFPEGKIETLYVVGNGQGYSGFGVFSFEDGFVPADDGGAANKLYLPISISN